MQQETTVSGILFLSFQQACSNLEFYIDEDTLSFLAGLSFEGWYPLKRYNNLLETVAGRYANPASVLERLGEEMMNVWFHHGPGKSIVKSGIDFLAHQSSSAGYYSLIRGTPLVVGDFALASLDEPAGTAVVKSTTPFSKDLEKGVLQGGLALVGDLRLVEVDNSADPQEYKISFTKSVNPTEEGAEAIGLADEFFSGSVPVAGSSVPIEVLQEIYYRYRELRSEHDKNNRYWHSTNQTLSDALVRNQQQKDELHQVNENLRNSNRRTRILKDAIVDLAIDGVVTFDDQKQIVEFNPSAERIFGIKADDVIGRVSARRLLPTSVFTELENNHSTDQRTATEVIHAGGHTVPVEFVIRRVEIENGCFYTAYFHDMSDIAAAEREIERQREALLQSEKLSAMGSLLSGIAHELNNPLSVVAGRAMLLEQENTEPELSRPLEKIRQASERCTRIVKTFLAMARQQEPERSNVNVNALVRDTVEFLAYSLRTSGVDVVQNLDDEIPDIYADATQLNQVITNLLINAQQSIAEAPSPRKIVITTDLIHVSETGTVRIRVKDNGAGVPEAIRRRIFEPFYTTKPAGAGTGVGLSLSHSLIIAHGGTLELSPDTRAGAEFIVTLPVAVGGETEHTENDVVKTQPDPVSVLIVDDEADFADMVRDMLQSQGHTITIVSSGRIAVEQLQKTTFDVILSDLNMPDMNGQELYELIQSDYPKFLSALAFVTGDTLSSKSQPFLSRAGQRHIEKPFTPKEIRELVNSIVADKK